MSARLVVLSVAIVLVAVAIVPCHASFAPPPRPPAGWQDIAAPGFEPGIEASLVELVNAYYPMLPEAMDERVHGLWEAWGEAAVAPLTALFRDEAWEGFTPLVARLLALSPFEPAYAFLADTLRHVTDDRTRHHYVTRALVRYQPERAMALFGELVESGREVSQRVGMQGLLSLRTPEAMAKAKAALGTLPEPMQDRFRGQMDFAESFVRAREPMTRILEQEEGS
jgi:hypothetical protein